MRKASVWRYKLKGRPRWLYMVGPRITLEQAQKAVEMHYAPEEVEDVRAGKQEN